MECLLSSQTSSSFSPRYSWAHTPVARAIRIDDEEEAPWWHERGRVVCAVVFIVGINSLGWVSRLCLEHGSIIANASFWLQVHAALCVFSAVFVAVMALTRFRLSMVAVLSMLTIWFAIVFGVFLLMTMAIEFVERRRLK